MNRPSRRSVLRGGLTLAGTASLGAWPRASEAGEAEDHSLVVVDLFGGNDGLMTVVPYDHDAYARSRKTTRLFKKDLYLLRQGAGLHPELRQLFARYSEGRVAFIEGCGFPRSPLSHFAAREVWHAASEHGRAYGEGWLARLCDALPDGELRGERLVHIGPEVPYSVYSTRNPPLVFDESANYELLAAKSTRRAHNRAWRLASAEPGARAQILDTMRRQLRTTFTTRERVARARGAYRACVEYPGTRIGSVFHTVAALLNSDLRTRVYSVVYGNFDTHGRSQAREQAELFSELDAALGAFFDDIEGTEAGRRTVVLLFSEFGRRLAENGAQGTDHGRAGPMVVMGSAVRGGFYGAPPNLEETDEFGCLVPTTDFRRVYASLAEPWMGVDRRRVIDGDSAPLPLLA